MPEYHPSAHRPWYRRWWGICLILLVVPGAYLAVQVPTDAGSWHESHERSALFELRDRQLIVRNVRDFRYAPDRRAVKRDYLEKTLDLNQLTGMWFALSHFGPFGLAHTMVSFEFADGKYLALSVEARLRPGQFYNPWRGMFRQYAKIYVASTEQDVFGLRSHIRGETMLLYPVISESRADVETYLLDLVEDATALHQQPEFYNTILDNCLTNLLKRGVRVSEVSPADFRVLIPGHSDRLSYALGITPDDISFTEARRRATVDPALAPIDDGAFSAALRCGWNDYLDRETALCPR